MKFKLSDFLQLDTKSLFSINGGSDCSGSSSSYASSESSSGGSESSGDGSSGGGGSSVTTIYSSHSNSNAASSAGGSCSSFLKNSDGTYKTDFTSTATTKNPVTQPSNSENTSPSVGGLCSGSGGGTKESATVKIEGAINEIGTEVEGAYVVGEYQCDEYVADVLERAGYDPGEYYVDNPGKKTVNNHIEEYISIYENGKTGIQKPQNCDTGVYVVFMQDKDNVKESHAAIMVVNSNGSAYMADNSSKNNEMTNLDGSPLLDSNGTVNI